MNLYEAQLEIKKILSEYTQQIERDGLVAVSLVDFQTDEFEPCDEKSRKLAYICGSLEIRAEGANEDEALVFELIIDCKKNGTVSEEDFRKESADFCAELNTFIFNLDCAPNPQEFIEGEIREADKACEEALQEFETNLNKFTKRTVICGIVIIAVIAIIATVLSRLLN